MITNQKVTGTAKSMPVGLLSGWMIEVGITLLCCTLLSAALIGGNVNWDTAGYLIMVFLVTASFIGAAFSCHLIKRRMLLVCFLSGIVYLATLILVSVLFFDADFSSLGITCALILCGSLASLLAKFPRPNTVSSKKRKRRN